MKLFLRSFSSLPLNHSRRVVVSYKGKYEGRSIFNENSCFIFTHFIITFIKRSVSWLNNCKIAVVQLLII